MDELAEAGKSIVDPAKPAGAKGALADDDETAEGALADDDETAEGALADDDETAEGALADDDETAEGALADDDETAEGALADDDETAEGALADDDETAEGARFGWEDWTWDKSLFQGAAPYYLRGRIPYAQGLADSIAEALGLDGHGRLLDVGCGPGVIALRLAHLFESVVGLDSDADMLEEGRRAAREQRVENASWAALRAEDLPAGLGTFTVITFAQSFHWMDRPKVAAAARAMIESNGAVLQIDPGRDGIAGDPAAGPHPAVPFQAIDTLRRSYLGPDRRAGQGRRNTSPSGEDAIFQAAGFLPELQVRVADARILDRVTDDLVAWVFSASSTAPHLFGNQLERFEADLRALLNDASPSGHFSVPLSDTALRIRRPTAN